MVGVSVYIMNLQAYPVAKMQPQSLTTVKYMFQFYFSFCYLNETVKPNIGRLNVF
jgi:hypothetical protein